jgi:hypothetical protein
MLIDEMRQRTKHRALGAAAMGVLLLVVLPSVLERAVAVPSPASGSAASPLTNVNSTNAHSEASASQCLRLVSKDNRNAIANTCSRPVNYAFCGTDVGVGESVGVCGRDIGGSLLAPGQVSGLTQGTGGSRVTYYYMGCFSPYIPFNVSFTGRGLSGECEHL